MSQIKQSTDKLLISLGYAFTILCILPIVFLMLFPLAFSLRNKKL